MSETNFDAVGDFHERFGLDNVTHRRSSPHLLSEELTAFRTTFLMEELDELINAYEADDLVAIADALVDIVYVALGTAQFHGLPWQALFDEVQRANMLKVRAAAADESKRNSSYDVVKPDGWQPPDIEGVLKAHGWRTEDDR